MVDLSLMLVREHAEREISLALERLIDVQLIVDRLYKVL
jgi:hypothetical protein